TWTGWIHGAMLDQRSGLPRSANERHALNRYRTCRFAVAAAASEADVVGTPPHVRIGAAMGAVVAGEAVSSGDSRQQTAIGENTEPRCLAPGPRWPGSGG